MARTSASISSKQIEARLLATVGIKGGDQIHARLRLFIDNFCTGMASVTPEFGAYMYYSGWLEDGTKRMPPRPHIRPAIFSNRDIITLYVSDFVKERFKAAMAGQGTTINQIGNMWLRVLNNAPRRHAVDSARSAGAWRYGFHVRSIRGYASARSVGDIKAEQQSMKDALKQRLDAIQQKKYDRATRAQAKRREQDDGGGG